jgi:hypothetical protein
MPQLQQEGVHCTKLQIQKEKSWRNEGRERFKKQSNGVLAHLAWFTASLKRIPYETVRPYSWCL